jgi:hypothetical protein
MVIQGGNSKRISCIAAQIDTIHIILMDRKGLVQFCDKNGHHRVQFIFNTYIAFIITRLRGAFSFTTEENKKRAY